MHFKHNQLMFWVYSGLRCSPGSPLSCVRGSDSGNSHAGDSYPAVETDPVNPTRPKNPSRERKRAVSRALATLPLSVRIPRANIAARSEAVALRVGLRASARAQDSWGLNRSAAPPQNAHITATRIQLSSRLP